MTDVIVYGDTIRSPELRHEVPLGIGDPFLYVERNGDRHVVISSMEAARMGGLGLVLHPWEEFGVDELRARGLPIRDAEEEIASRAVAALGVERARVPETFPLRIADRLRADGVELEVDGSFFDERRRAKSDAELAGMRRAQRAAEAAMDTCRELLRTEGPGAS